MVQLARVCLIGSLILALLFGAAPVKALSGSNRNLLQQSTGTIVIVKDTVPDDPQDFIIQFSPTGGGFTVDDDPNDGSVVNQITRTLEAGTYTVTEGAATGWLVTAITCDDPSSSGNAGNRTATIDLDPGETVTCTFTNEPDPNVPRGTLVVVKDAVPDDPQDFNFSIPGIDVNFLLDDDPGSADPTNQYSATVAIGTYTATEQDVTGWDLAAITCTDPDNGSSTNLAARRATLDIDANEVVTCTFRNEPAAVGTIRVIKDAIPDDPQDFVMQLRDASGAAAGGAVLDDDPGSPAPNNEFSIIREAGTYTATETAVSGWTLTSLTCDDPDNGSSGDISTRTATIDLDADETVTCTFTNTKDGQQPTTGTIVIVKDAVPNDPQDFKFFGGDLQVAPFFLDDDSDPTLPNQITFTNVSPGLHFVVEDQDPTGWDLTGIICDDPDNGSFINLANREAAIEVDAGETVTCTFTNTNVGGTIVIVKDAVPNDAQDFKFFGGDLQVEPFFLDDDSDPTLSNQITFTNVDPGLHFVVEDQAPTAWNLTDISCDDPDNGSFINLGNREAAIEVDANETVTCTFTNTMQAQVVSDLTITKNHTGNFTQGQTGAQYTIRVSNVGAGPTSGTVSVVDNLPAGLTATGLSGNGWSCSLATLTCTRSNALAANSSYPNIILSVSVAVNVPSSLTNSVSVSGGGEQNTGNNTANDPTTIEPASQAPICDGRAATIYVDAQGRIVGGPNHGQVYAGRLNGTSSADVMVGTNGADEIEGKGGADRICGGGGNDELEGGGGDDRIFGGEGRDDLKGGGGNDSLFGEGGNDTLAGGDGKDTLTGGTGADRFNGGPGTDTATDFSSGQGDTKTGVENT